MAQEREPKRMPTPEAAGWPADSYSADLGHGAGELVDVGDPTEETRTLHHHETLPPPLDGLAREDRDALVILVEGTQLRQGAIYVDLDDFAAGPFRALAGQRVRDGQRIVPKHRVGYVLWDQIVGRDAEADVIRPREDR
jgi:hypothetical protein